MGIRLPKYLTRTWQGLFSPDAAKIKDPAHAANGRPHRARAQSQSTEPVRGEQDEPRMNPEPPEPVPHPEPPAVVRPESEAQQVELPEPPAEVQHPPEEVQRPASRALVQPTPSEAEPSPAPLAVNGGPKRPAVVQETGKVRYPHGPQFRTSLTRTQPDSPPGDDRDRQIARLQQELADSAKASSEYLQQYQQLQATLAQQKLSITELTETILRTVHSRAETARDDDYFEIEFARLANAIHQWVFRYFHLVSETKHAALPPILKECLNNTVFEYSALQQHAVRRKEVEAAVSERIYSCIFRSPFLFGKNGMGYRAVRSILAGTGRSFVRSFRSH